MSIFSPGELEGMKDCSWVLHEIVRDLEKAVRAGQTTADLDRLAGDLVETYGVRAAFKGYRGYPCCITASVNEEVIDGVPGARALRSGDLLKVQIGIESDGYFAYWADTYAIGDVPAAARNLVAGARRALSGAVAACEAGVAVESVSRAIQSEVERSGLESVRQYCGHGIGRQMHEEPQIPCYLDARNPGSYRLAEGEVIALQVLVLERAARLSNRGGLTVCAPRGVLSAHVGAIVAAGRPPSVLLGGDGAGIAGGDIKVH